MSQTTIERRQLAYDTAANWTAQNPILAMAEIGYETDTQKQKIGDGATAWNSLGYGVDVKNKSLVTNGYQKLASGLIMQWGSVTATATWATVAFPVPFPTACLSVSISKTTDYTNGVAASAYDRTFLQHHSSSGSIDFTYIAVGY